MRARLSNVDHKWWTLFAMCFALFMIMLDNTIVNVALPSIQRDLKTSPANLQWTIDAYILTIAALILLGSHKALGRHLGQSEVIFEYRARDGAIEHQSRIEHRAVPIVCAKGSTNGSRGASSCSRRRVWRRWQPGRLRSRAGRSSDAHGRRAGAGPFSPAAPISSRVHANLSSIRSIFATFVLLRPT